MDLVRVIHERRVAFRNKIFEQAELLKKQKEKPVQIAKEPTLDEFELQLKRMPRSIFKRPAWKQIAMDICKKYDVSFEEIIGEDRKRDLVRVRQEIFYTIRTELGWSLPEIGNRFNRDHTTILHGIQKYEERLKSSVKEEN